jgi:regulator of replication initiation timing
MGNDLYAEIDRLRADNAVLTEDIDAWRKRWLSLSEEVAKLKAENEKLKSNIRMLIEFVPDGFAMPMGWNELVQQVRKEAEHD